MVGHARIGHEAVAQPFAAILVTDAVNGVLLASRPVVIEPEALEGLVRGDPLVTRDPVTGAQLELVEEPERLDPGLLLQLPAYRTRREKAPAVSLGEFRSAVGSCRESHQITVLERIVQAGEPRSEDLLAARRRSYDLIRAGNDLVLERRVGEPATGNARTAAYAVLVASAQHGGKGMVADSFVVGEVGIPRQVDIGRLAVSPFAIVVIPGKGIERRIEIGRPALLGAGVARHRHDQSLTSA